MLKEFKEFATRGNIIDLAVGVVIGGAFQKIINSLVNDIIMPAISIISGKVDFSDMMFEAGSVSIKYGNFITEIVNFLIIAFSIFLAITYVNKLSKKMEAISLGQLDKLNKKIIELGDKLNKPVLATGDVHYLKERYSRNTAKPPIIPI